LVSQPQLVSVYIREEWPPRVCPWGTHFCERVNAYKTIYITCDTAVGPGLGWVVGQNDIYFLFYHYPKALRVTIKFVTNRHDPKRVSRKFRIYPIKKRKRGYLRIKPTWSPSHSFFVTNSAYKRRARPAHSSHRNSQLMLHVLILSSPFDLC